MNPDDSSVPNVCLLQCALFFKGYAAGGITGIYYTSGVNAVTQLQKDANIGVTGKVDWKVWLHYYLLIGSQNPPILPQNGIPKFE